MPEPKMTTKVEVVRMLRRAGLWELAEHADRVLPDDVALERAADIGWHYGGITRDELISLMGGSP